MQTDESALFEYAQDVAREAGHIVRQQFGKSTIRQKASNNLVTQTDMEAEEIIKDRIATRFPDHAILSEETCATTSPQSTNLWIIDPIDGTNNFAHGIPHFCVSVAFAGKGAVDFGVIYDPMRDELFTGFSGRSELNNQPISVSSCSKIEEAIVTTGFHYDRGELARKTIATIQRLLDHTIRDIRRTGSAALDLCWTACGRFDAYFEYQLSPWDYAAGMCILRNAGGECLSREGEDARLDTTGIIAASPSLLPSILPQLRYRTA